MESLRKKAFKCSWTSPRRRTCRARNVYHLKDGTESEAMHPMIRTCLTYLTTYWTFLPNFREQATHVILHLDSGDDVTVMPSDAECCRVLRSSICFRQMALRSILWDASCHWLKRISPHNSDQSGAFAHWPKQVWRYHVFENLYILC